MRTVVAALLLAAGTQASSKYWCYMKESAEGKVAKDGTTTCIPNGSGTCTFSENTDVQNNAGGSAIGVASKGECCEACVKNSSCKAAAFVGAGMLCATTGDGGEVIHVKDSNGTERCASVITPPTAKTPMPVLFWFHGSGGNAAHCGSGELGTLAQEYGFALVCGEALQGYFSDHGGQWDIPEVQTNTTGTRCATSDSVDVGYINNIVAELQAKSAKYDTTKIFTSGCSMGSAFSGYISKCLKKDMPDHISAFATHSTGLKVKGDGNSLPPDNSGDGYTWGDCPNCGYFPFVPQKYTDSLGLKACIFDNTGDNSFYQTSLYLAKIWKELGNKEADTFLSGGHCEIHSYAAIVNCLDDGTGRLLRNGSIPVTPAPPGPAPGPGPSPPSPSGTPSAACQKCFVDACPGKQNKNNDDCQNCVKQHQQSCSSSCMPAPFPEVLAWFCNPPTNATQH